MTGEFWSADVPVSMPLPVQETGIIPMFGWTFTENGLAHDLSPADYERISTPDFAPESMPEGIEYGDTDVDEPFSHVEWY